MQFLNPAEILELLPLKPTMKAADLGCGSGGWTIPLAKKLSAGKVWAVDILEEPLSSLRSKKKLFGLSNIETIKANIEEKIPLPPESCDLVLLVNVLFQNEEIEKIIKEATRILKNGGFLLIADWNQKLSSDHLLISSEKVKEIAKNFPLKREREIDWGPYHYVIIYKKDAK